MLCLMWITAHAASSMPLVVAAMVPCEDSPSSSASVRRTAAFAVSRKSPVFTVAL